MKFFYSKIQKQNGQKFSWTSVNTLEVEPVHPAGKLVHFQVQTSTKEGKDRFYGFSCINSLWIFFHPKISKQTSKNLSWTSVKTLEMK